MTRDELAKMLRDQWKQPQVLDEWSEWLRQADTALAALCPPTAPNPDSYQQMREATAPREYAFAPNPALREIAEKCVEAVCAPTADYDARKAERIADVEAILRGVKCEGDDALILEMLEGFAEEEHALNHLCVGAAPKFSDRALADRFRLRAGLAEHAMGWSTISSGPDVNAARAVAEACAQAVMARKAGE